MAGTPSRDAKRVRDAISDAANRMVLNGARQILLFNLRIWARTPRPSQKVVEAASHVSAYHNQLLLNLARQLAPHRHGEIVSRSTNLSSPRMLREPQNFGLSDTREHACYGGGYVWEAVRLPQRRHRQSAGPQSRRSALPSPATPAGSGRRNAQWRAAMRAS